MPRTTFFKIEIVGPNAAATITEAARDNGLWVRMERLSTDKVRRLSGAWSEQALRKVAERGGARLVWAYTLARDAKGYIHSSRRAVGSIALPG